MTLQELRAALRRALDAESAALDAVSALGEDATDEQITAAESARDAAIAARQRAQVAFDQRRDLEEARDNLPIDPAADADPPAGDQRGAGDPPAGDQRRGGGPRVGREERTYRPDRSDSLCLDVVAMARGAAAGQLGLDEDAARQRLARHQAEATDYVERVRRNEPGRMRELREAGLTMTAGNPAGETRDTGTPQAAGFIVPLYMLDEFQGLVRHASPISDLIGPLPLPDGVGSIEVPRITAGSTVSTQLTEGATVAQNDMASSTTKTDIATLAGSQTVPVQVLQNSGLNVDQWLIPDLLAAYAATKEAQVLNGAGNGTNKQIRGILGVAGTTGVTYTSSTPTAVGVDTRAAKVLADLEAAVPNYPPEVWLMAARRWYSQVSAVDKDGRPRAAWPIAGANAVNVNLAQDSLMQGLKGIYHGLPAYTTGPMPTNLGAGTNEDVVVAFRPSDVLLWEGERNLFVSEHFLASTLRVFFRLHAFAAQIPDRLPAAQGRLTGTGLVTPGFTQE